MKYKIQSILSKTYTEIGKFIWVSLYVVLIRNYISFFKQMCSFIYPLIFRKWHEEKDYEKNYGKDLHILAHIVGDVTVHMWYIYMNQC